MFHQTVERRRWEELHLSSTYLPAHSTWWHHPILLLLFPSFSMFSLLYLILAPATVTNRIWCPILFPRPGSQLSSFLGLNGHGMGYRGNQAEKLSLVFFLLLWSSSSISFPLSSPSQISISKKKDKLRIYLWGKRRSFLLKVRFILSLSLSRSLALVRGGS